MRIGLIGFGGMGKTHAWAVENLKYYYAPLPFSAKITGVCTAHPETAAEACERYGLGRVYASQEEMIADPAIDVIDICTPNIFHYETLKKAILAGKHIYCEKPLCVSAEEAFEIAALAKASGRTCAVVFNTRFLLPVMRAKELADAGRLGRILSFRGAFLHSSAADPKKNAGWKQDREICGGGVLFDLGSHTIDLIQYLCGSFVEVTGWSQIAYPKRCGRDGREWSTNAEEAFYLTAKLTCGAVGTITVGKIMCGANDDHSFEIYGERGSLRFNLMQPNFLWFYDNTAPERERGYVKIECCGRYPAPGGVFPGVKAPIGWLRGHLASMYNFLDGVYREGEVSPSFDEAAHVQAVMEAAYLSDKSGQREVVRIK